jgi:hypothetical protein
VSEDVDSDDIAKMDAEGISVIKKPKEDALFNFLITDSEVTLKSAEKHLKEEGIVLLKTKEVIPETEKYSKLNFVAQRKSKNHVFYLFRKVWLNSSREKIPRHKIIV